MEGQPRGWPSFLVCSAWVRFDGVGLEFILMVGNGAEL